ncbi:MAG TPA: GGDEF domain-containing protein [Gammaproteobacteria bacterium]|nr:GGDEF domain-containing protein [Gammaproteobacteria bacterium]
MLSAMVVSSLIAMCVLLGILALVVARGQRGSLALRLWGWGLITYAIGMFIAIVAGLWLPWFLTQVVGNSLISLGALLTAYGVFMHVPVRPGRTAMIGGLGLTVTILILNHVLHGHLIIDIAAPTLYATLLYIMVSWQLIRHPPLAALAAARFLVITVLLTLLVWNARLMLIWKTLGGTSDGGRVDFLQAGFSIFQMLLIVSSSFGLMWIEVRMMEDDLRRSAYTDLLTGLPNRRAMLVRFGEEAARAKRERQRFGVVLFDIDHFKQINDTCGHYVGDAVLKHIAATFTGAKRAEDALGRIGGEEFLVLLPHHEREKSIAAAERLREALEAAQPHQDVQVPTATVSGGVAIYPDDGEDWDRLFMAADRRMYRAKRAGRNKIEGLDD